MTRDDSPPSGAGNPAAAARRPEPFPAWLVMALLTVATMLLYVPVLQYDFVGFDDPFYVTANPQVQSGLTLANAGWAFTTGEAANWHPLTWLSLMLDASLFGTKPAGFHLDNIVLHAIDSALLFWLLRRITGAYWRSAIVAALFAWHPLHVESVAWISERKDVLSAFFGFLSLIFYARYAWSQAARLPPDAPFFALHSSFTLSLLCFALGLMSKPMLVTWPFVLLLLDYWPFRRVPPFQPSAFSFQPFRAWWPLVREKIAFFGLSVAASIVTFLVQRQGGAVVSEDLLPPGARVGNALISYCRYMGKLVWPVDLSILYAHAGYWPWWEVLPAGLFLGGVSALVWRGRRRYSFLLMGWLWFLGTLVPVIGLVQVGEQSMADRYMYLPSVGLLVLIVWGAHELICHAGLQRRRGLQIAGAALAAAALAVCPVLTRVQMGYWQNKETLFRRALMVTKNSYTVRNNIGKILLDEGQADGAVSQFREALRLRPAFPPALYNLAVALDRDGQTQEAIKQYLEALRLQPNDPNIHNNFSSALVRAGQTNSALDQLREAIRLDPNFAMAHENLANLLFRQGASAAAAQEYARTLQLQPDNAEAHYNLGGILLQEGDLDAATVEFQAATTLRPGDPDAHYDLGKLLVRKGRVAAAMNEFEQTVRLRPGDAVARNNLGLLLLATGQTPAAIAEFQAALRLLPDNAQIHNSLGNALATEGQTGAAIKEFEEALRLHPDYTNARQNLARLSALKNEARPPADDSLK